MRRLFELVRVFLTPSAPADSIAGYAVAVAGFGGFDAARLAWVVATSVFLYWFGMATNDIFDRDKDRELAPFKPLASGRIDVREASIVASALAALALATSWLAGAFLPAVAILVLAVAYNVGGKRIPVLGNLLMGSCRAGNFLLGATAVAGLKDCLESPGLLVASGIVGLFVAGITAVSVLEDRRFRAWQFHTLATPLLAVPLALGAWQAHSPYGWLNSVALLWLLLRTQRRAAAQTTSVHPAAVYVRTALGGIFLVDAGLIWAFSPPQPILYAAPIALYSLALLGWWWKRRWLQSGGPDT